MMNKIKDVCYCEENSLCLDIYLPDAEEFPVFLYFHGGGLEYGTKADQTDVFNDLVARGICVISADYRLYNTPENPDNNAQYPDFLEDAAKAVSWVKNNIGKYGKAKELYVGGSSAGGYITLMLCFDKKWLGKYGISPMDITGFIHDAGQPTCHFTVLKKRGINEARVIVDETSPLYHVGTDTEYPPMLIIVSDNDMLNRYEQTMLLISTLKHFGHGSDKVAVKVMHGTHCHYLNLTDEDGINVFSKIVLDYILNNN